MSCSISFTNDIPKSPIKATVDKDVTLGWSFSYNDLRGSPPGPFSAPGVHEITFGIYEPIHDRNFMTKKLVVVDSGGNFKVRDGYDSKMGWSYSKYRLTFTLKNFTIQDRALYGVNVELGLSQMPLKHSVIVTTGPSYVVQHGSSIIRNESAYIMEDFDLSFTRLIQDRIVGRAKYTLSKNNVAILIIGKDRVDKKFSCYQVTEIPSTPCPVDDFSVNETYVSFKLRNVSLQDAGRYLCEKFLPRLHDTILEEINLNVQERPTVKIKNDETSTPRVKSSYSVTIPSVVSNVSPGVQRISEKPPVRGNEVLVLFTVALIVSIL